ncbi:hypothetical protein J7M07_00695, partial [bacterium]|nr:hypothetical protein [bacterium]
MSLSNLHKSWVGPAAIGGINGATYIFVSRTIGTFKPEIFMNLNITRANTLISFIAAAAILYFYVIFYIEFAKKETNAVRIASFVMLIGSFFVTLLFLKGILMVFNIYHFRSPIFNILVPSLSSLIALYFFITLYKEIECGGKGLLRQALFLAALGSGLSVFTRGLITYNYFAEKKFEWIWRYT